MWELVMNKNMVCRICGCIAVVCYMTFTAGVDKQRVDAIIADYKNDKLREIFEKEVWSQKSSDQAQRAAYKILHDRYDNEYELYGEEPLSDDELQVIWDTLKERHGNWPLQKLKAPQRKEERYRKTQPLRMQVLDNELSKDVEKRLSFNNKIK